MTNTTTGPVDRTGYPLSVGGRHLSPARARMVLEMWARRDQLTLADVEQVIQRYRGGAR